jgi:hypothetical protein
LVKNQFVRTGVAMKNFLLAVSTATLLAMAVPAGAQTTESISPAEQTGRSTFNTAEIVNKGHQIFGSTTRGIGEAIEYAFQSQGEPSAYIVGEEGSGAFVGGLRYGEGTIYYKNGEKQKIFWQGPSVGWDFGANGSRTMVLVYNSNAPEDIYGRFGGVEGSAYLVGGLGVNFQKRGEIVMAPIRAGVGARLGANIGYLKYSATPTWNPF